MINLEIPAIKLTLKEPTAPLKGSFTVTYECSWRTNGTQTYNVAPANDASISCWNGSITFNSKP
jgi:hypothetical protein